VFPGSPDVVLFSSTHQAFGQLEVPLIPRLCSGSGSVGPFGWFGSGFKWTAVSFLYKI